MKVVLGNFEKQESLFVNSLVTLGLLIHRCIYIFKALTAFFFILDWGTTEEGSVYRFKVPLEEYYREVEELYEQRNKQQQS